MPRLRATLLFELFFFTGRIWVGADKRRPPASAEAEADVEAEAKGVATVAATAEDRCGGKGIGNGNPAG